MPFGRFGYLALAICTYFLLCKGGVHIMHDAHGPGSVAHAQDELVMYSTASCPYCKRARTYLTANDIPFTERDIASEADAKREFEALEGTGVPLFTLNGEQMQGWSANGIKQFLSES